MITPTVKIGSYALHDLDLKRYITSLKVNDSVPQVLDIFTVAKSDLHKVTAGWLDVNTFTISGTIEADSETDMVTQEDELKKQLMGVGLTFFFSDGTNHRIWYVNTDGAIAIERDRIQCISNWSVKFVVANPVYGIEAESDGTPKENTQSFSLTSLLNTFTTTFDGTARPTPKLTFTLDSSGVPDLEYLYLLNKETGQSLSIDFSSYTLASGDVIVVDSSRREVLFRGRPIAYGGTIPDYSLGNNEMEVFFATENSTILVASQNVANDFEIIRDGIRTAQQFTPASGQNMAFISVALQKVGNPTGDVRIGIMADSAGSPSGTYLGSTVTIDIATIKSTLRWFTIALAGVGITAASPYWLVLDAPSSGTDQTEFVKWAKSRQDQGFGSLKNHDGSSWGAATGDATFRAYTSNSVAQNQNIDTQNNVLNLSATTQKEAGDTTAKWNGTDGYISMNGVVTNPTTSFAGVTNTFDIDACRFCNDVFWKFTVPGIAGTTVKLKTVRINAKHLGTAGDLNLVLRSSYNGSAIATSDTKNISSGSFTGYTFTFNYNLVAGQTYWLGTSTATWALQVQGVTGTAGSSYNASTTLVALLTDWSRNTTMGGNPFFSGTAGIDYTATYEYTSYAAAEVAVTTQLNANNADIISVSQVTTTILTGGGTYQGAVSADDGANYTNIVRDLSAFATESIPAVVSNELRQKMTLQNTVSLNNQLITATTLYWREGISLDAATKYASQGFQPTATGSVNTAKLHLMKLGSPGNLTVRVETDSTGSPSGTLAHANATATVSAADISASTFGFVNVAFAGSFTLNAATTYHLVIRPSTADDSNKVLLNANFGRYAVGEMKRSTDSGSSYSGFTSGTSGYDLLFAILGSGGFNFTSNLDVTHNNLWL